MHIRGAIVTASWLLMAACDIGGREVDAPLDVAPQWSLKEQARIGSVDDTGQNLTDVDGAVFLPDGDLLVADRLAAHIKVFSTSGVLERIIGRPGAGPGEFGDIQAIGFSHDSVYVSDIARQRITYFSSELEYAGTRPLLTESFQVDQFRYFPTVPQILLPDGSALVKPRMSFPVPPGLFDPGVHLLPSKTLYFHVSSVAEVLDTIALVESEDRSLRIAHQGSTLVVGVPLLDGPLSQLSPDGSGLVIVDRRSATRGGEASFQVLKLDPDGDTVFIASMPYTPIATTDAVVLDELEGVFVQTPTRMEEVSGNSAEIARELRRADLIPDFVPPVTALSVTQNGWIWLRREQLPGDSVEWQILDGSGTSLARVRLLPGQLVVASRDSLMAAFERDDLDVPYISIYRIAGPAGHSR